MTEADYLKASRAVCTTCAVSPEMDEIRGNDENVQKEKMPGNPGNSSSFSVMAEWQVGNTGLEPDLGFIDNAGRNSFSANGLGSQQRNEGFPMVFFREQLPNLDRVSHIEHAF